MNAKEYLMQCQYIDARLKTIDANIERIRKELYLMGDISLSSSWGDGQPHSTQPGDPTGKKATKLADSNNAKREELKGKLLKLEYGQIMLRSELWSKRMEIIDKISMIVNFDHPETTVYYKLLTMRYVEGKSWETIAVDIGYTWRHTIRLHGEALKRMERVING